MIRTSSSFEAEWDSGILTVKVTGEIDHHSAVTLRQGMDALLYEKRPRMTVLDLSGVDFMDSSGLGLIMGRYTLLKDFGGTLTLKDPTQAILKILKLAGMEKVIKIEKGEKDK